MTVTITNDGDEVKTGVIFEFEEDDPFELKSEAKWTIGTLDVEEEITNTFRIEVDDDTLEDEYDLEFTLDDDKDDFVDEFGIEVGSDNSDLVVGSVMSAPGIISPDLEDIKLTIKIENLGGGDATFVRARIELPEGFSASSSFSDSVDLGTIGAKGDTEAVFFIDSARALNSGRHTGVLVLNYKNSVENEIQRLEFDLPTKGRPLFSIISSVTEPKKVGVGGSGRLSIRIANIGEEEGKETSVRVFENADFPIDFDEKINFVGSLERGDEGTAVFDFEIDNNANPNTYLVKVQTRTLSEGNILVEASTVPVVVIEGGGKWTLNRGFSRYRFNIDLCNL